MIARAAAHPPEYTWNHPLKMSSRLHDRHSSAVAFVVGYASTENNAVKVKTQFWGALDHAVNEAPRDEHLFVLMDANARTGTRGNKDNDNDAKSNKGQSHHTRMARKTSSSAGYAKKAIISATTTTAIQAGRQGQGQRMRHKDSEIKKTKGRKREQQSNEIK